MNYSAKLPRSRMLKVRADISRGLKKGQKIKGEYLTLVLIEPGIIIPPKGLDWEKLRDEENEAFASKTKIAVLVRRNLGKAHKRNRIKRLVREFYRRRQPELTGFEAVIFSIEKPIDDESFFLKELQELWSQSVRESREGARA